MAQFRHMTAREKIIACSKLDGFEILERETQWNTKTTHFIQFAGQPIERKIVFCELPSYLRSRNAIIPVIEKQRQNIRHEVYRILWRQFDNLSLAESVDVVFLATPEQLTDALLKATGEWKE